MTNISSCSAASYRKLISTSTNWVECSKQRARKKELYLSEKQKKKETLTKVRVWRSLYEITKSQSSVKVIYWEHSQLQVHATDQISLKSQEFLKVFHLEFIGYRPEL